MTGNLDTLVAEHVMGWKYDGYWYEGTCYKGIEHVDGGDGESEGWCPSEDMNHAWEVVDNILDRSGRWDFDMYWDSMINQWRAQFFCHATGEHYRSPANDKPTAPQAICLAALKAVGYEGEIDE